MTDKSYIDVVYGSNKKPFTAYPEKLIKLLKTDEFAQLNFKE